MWDLLNPSSWFNEQRLLLSSLVSWTGVHVRLGDYKDIPGMQISEVYYRRSLGLLQAMGNLDQIVVFSDEIELTKQMALWREFNDVIFIESHQNVRPIEPMLLMSLADRLVVANSSFSWWSAWIGKKEGQRVVCPRPWGNTTYETRDFLPPDWITVGRETG
jgi:hypothetical protein